MNADITFICYPFPLVVGTRFLVVLGPGPVPTEDIFGLPTYWLVTTSTSAVAVLLEAPDRVYGVLRNPTPERINAFITVATYANRLR